MWNVANVIKCEFRAILVFFLISGNIRVYVCSIFGEIKEK